MKLLLPSAVYEVRRGTAILQERREDGSQRWFISDEGDIIAGPFFSRTEAEQSAWAFLHSKKALAEAGRILA